MCVSNGSFNPSACCPWYTTSCGSLAKPALGFRSQVVLPRAIVIRPHCCCWDNGVDVSDRSCCRSQRKLQVKSPHFQLVMVHTWQGLHAAPPFLSLYDPTLGTLLLGRSLGFMRNHAFQPFLPRLWKSGCTAQRSISLLFQATVLSR